MEDEEESGDQINNDQLFEELWNKHAPNARSYTGIHRQAMNKLTYSQNLKLETHNGVVFCNGKNREGQIFWVYIMTDRDSMRRLYEDCNSKSDIDFMSYGRVLAKGFDEPSEEIKCIIKDKYIEELLDG